MWGCLYALPDALLWRTVYIVIKNDNFSVNMAMGGITVDSPGDEETLHYTEC